MAPRSDGLITPLVSDEALVKVPFIHLPPLYLLNYNFLPLCPLSTYPPRFNDNIVPLGFYLLFFIYFITHAVIKTEVQLGGRSGVLEVRRNQCRVHSGRLPFLFVASYIHKQITKAKIRCLLNYLY